MMLATILALFLSIRVEGHARVTAELDGSARILLTLRSPALTWASVQFHGGSKPQLRLEPGKKKKSGSGDFALASTTSDGAWITSVFRATPAQTSEIYAIATDRVVSILVEHGSQGIERYDGSAEWSSTRNLVLPGLIADTPPPSRNPTPAPTSRTVTCRQALGSAPACQAFCRGAATFVASTSGSACACSWGVVECDSDESDDNDSSDDSDIEEAAVLGCSSFTKKSACRKSWKQGVDRCAYISGACTTVTCQSLSKKKKCRRVKACTFKEGRCSDA